VKLFFDMLLVVQYGKRLALLIDRSLSTSSWSERNSRARSLPCLTATESSQSTGGDSKSCDRLANPSITQSVYVPAICLCLSNSSSVEQKKIAFIRFQRSRELAPSPFRSISSETITALFGSLEFIASVCSNSLHN
jgi:hypothetical protein